MAIITTNQKTPYIYRTAGKKFVRTIFAVGVISLIFIVIIFTYALMNYGDAEKLGPLGDFTAGILNPIFTFFSFMAVLATLIFQKIELHYSRDDLKRSANALEAQVKSAEDQKFETTFFQMLTLHNTIVESISLYNPKKEKVNGRACFELFYGHLKDTYGYGRYRSIDDAELSEFEKASRSYNIFYNDYNLYVGHYFRFLYNFVKLIDENPGSQPYYMKLLRAQLSDQELIILFYNCISDRGSKFKNLAIKHELFDNMPVELLLDPSHLEFIQPQDR